MGFIDVRVCELKYDNSTAKVKVLDAAKKAAEAKDFQPTTVPTTNPDK